MKKNLIKATAFAVASLCLLTTTNAQRCFKDANGNEVTPDGRPCVKTIVTSLPFLRIGPDARSGAMGDAGIAVSPDANAMHFNGSKLAFADKEVGISATYTPWLRALGLTDVYLAHLSGYKKIDKLQALGASIRYFSLGQIDFTDENGQSLGGDRPNEFEINLTYARKLSKNLSAGLGLKYLYSRLAAGQTVASGVIVPVNSVAADVSFTYRKNLKISDYKSNLTVGAAFTNIGPKISYTKSTNKDFIPTNMGVGAALTMDFDEYNSLTVTTDINKLMVPTANEAIDSTNASFQDWKNMSPIEGMFSSFSDASGGGKEELRELMYSVGLEYWYDKQFAVRAGYYSEHATKGNRKFLTLGLGLKYQVFGLNFSYLVPTTAQRNPLDNTLRFSLLFDFGAFKDDDKDKK